MKKDSFTPRLGILVEKAIEQAVEQAVAFDCYVTMKVNGCELRISPYDPVKHYLKTYEIYCDRTFGETIYCVNYFHEKKRTRFKRPKMYEVEYLWGTKLGREGLEKVEQLIDYVEFLNCKK